MIDEFDPEKSLHQFIDHVHNKKILDFYNEFYKRAKESKAHSELCRNVYGEDFCQHGMLDMNQLDRLIEVSKLNRDTRVLELGSGAGLVAEYISDVTQCWITGIDISAEAIEYASARTKDKKNKIVFEIGDMADVCYPDNAFDAVISIDTLYFVKNLEGTIRNAVKSLRPKGRIYIFYHVDPDLGDCPSLDPVRCSQLGVALDKVGLEYQVIDFTIENIKHWELKTQVLLELRTKFEEENNLLLYSSRMEECMSNMCYFYRFLYIVERA
jgi:SAM-dependent methyltransferase